MTMITLLLASLLTAQTISQECYVPGQCIGQLIGYVGTTSDGACLRECKNEFDCKWFTSNSAEQFCGLFETCGIINVEECPDCVSGTYYAYIA